MKTDPKKEETPVDNSAEPTKTPEVPKEEPKDNVEEKLKELEQKIADQARKLDGSKEEALRLKKLNEELQAKIAEKPDDSPKLNESDIELFKQYAKKAGIPFKEEIAALQQQQIKEKQQEAIDRFVEEFPEYKPENDKDNQKWTILKEEFLTYKTPTNPKDIYRLLKKAHGIINPTDSLEKGKALGMAQAKLNEQAQLGGSSGVASTPNKKRTPEQQAARAEFEKIRPEIKQ